MNEDFLQYIWKFQQFRHFDLKSDQGEAIQVYKTGRHNQNAGPDFLDARLRIGDTDWAGNVEIHISSSDWKKHNHDRDTAYDNVILHVVYTHDADVFTSTGSLIPVLSIKDLFDYQTYRQYKSWLKSATFIPCEASVMDVPQIVKRLAIESAAIERINRRAELCFDYLNETKGDIEETFYRIFMKSVGQKLNAIPFEQLARRTPVSLIRKVWEDEHDLEALFLGQAGFLSKVASDEDYVTDLIRRYVFLQAKFDLEPLTVSSWKLFRLRPQNFPQVRLAQLAHFYARKPVIAQTVIERSDPEFLRTFFFVSLEKDFWRSHYTLEKKSASALKSLGDNTFDLILINAIVPFLFAISNYNKDSTYQNRAMSMLEKIAPEANKIVSKFRALDFPADTALDTQGMIHLKQWMCEPRKCLNCKVGIQILNKNAKEH